MSETGEIEKKEIEKETLIKVEIEQKWSPILRVTHEDFSIMWGVPFNVEVDEVRKDGIVTLELFGDYYIKKPLNANMRKALYYHIFRLKKPFFLVVPKHEMISRSGSHKIMENVYLQETQPFKAVLKEFIRFPTFAGLYPKDLEELDKAGEKYLALVHYNLLFTFENIERYNWNKIEFNLPCSCDTSGIAKFKGEIPFKATESVRFKGIDIKGNKTFKVVKGNKFIIIHNDNQETLKLLIGNKEIELPLGKAYYNLYY